MTLNIPVELGERVLQEKLTKPFQLYVALKVRCSGKMRLDSETWDDIKRDLGWKAEATARKHLNKLIELNWVGYNPTSGYYFIRGWEHLHKHYGIESVSGVTFTYSNLRVMRAFLFAACLGHLVKRREKGATEQKTAGSNQGRKPSFNFNTGETFLPSSLSVQALADIFKTTMSDIGRLKKAAKDAGFLNYYHNYQFLMEGSLFTSAKEGGEKKRISMPGLEDISHRIVGLSGFLYLQLTDTFETVLRYVVMGVFK